jgi:hypothetical protein
VCFSKCWKNDVNVAKFPFLLWCVDNDVCATAHVPRMRRHEQQTSPRASSSTLPWAHPRGTPNPPRPFTPPPLPFATLELGRYRPFRSPLLEHFCLAHTSSEDTFLVTASSALAGLAIAPTPPPYRSEPATSHNAHDPFSQFPGKKSWTIFGCLLKIVSPLTHNCCPEGNHQ